MRVCVCVCACVCVCMYVCACVCECLESVNRNKTKKLEGFLSSKKISIMCVVLCCVIRDELSSVVCCAVYLTV